MQDFDLIETPENVELRQPLAGIGTRFLAGLIDNLLIGSVMLVVAALAGLASYGTITDIVETGDWADAWLLAVLLVILFLVYWGYFVFFELYTNGQSPGKKHMKIRVVKEGGGAITFIDVIIRNLLRCVDAIGGYFVAGACMFISRKVQRLGDLAAGTVIVSESTTDYAATSAIAGRITWDQPITPEAMEATGLTPQEYGAVMSYWWRRPELTVEARRRVLPKLLRPIVRRVGVTLPGGSLESLESFVFTTYIRPAAGGQAPEEVRPEVAPIDVHPAAAADSASANPTLADAAPAEAAPAEAAPVDPAPAEPDLAEPGPADAPAADAPKEPGPEPGPAENTP